MAIKIPKISDIPEDERTPTVLTLLEIIYALHEENQQLKDEISKMKRQKPRPKINPSALEGRKKKNNSTSKRAGSAKRSKTKNLEVHETVKLPPENIPTGSCFKGYQDVFVQDLVIKPHNTRFRIECWQTPDGSMVRGKLPAAYEGGHFGPDLKRFILYQYHHCHVTQPLIYEQLLEVGIDISKGQIDRILTHGHERFVLEANAILETGVSVSYSINVDDTGARHQGKNGYCTHVGNEFFATFHSTGSKSRINFLEILRGNHTDYVLSSEALAYMTTQGLSQCAITKLTYCEQGVFADAEAWFAHLERLVITTPLAIKIATEGALIGSMLSHGVNPDLVIVSDDAGQFNILTHALCWIHAERTLAKIIAFTDDQRQVLKDTRSNVWDLYDQLKSYKEQPDDSLREKITAAFDDIFTQRTKFESLNSALERIHKNRNELLRVLDFPDIPLHNNLSENDIREYVKRRKISGSTRSCLGQKCRDVFTGLKKTCRKLDISFWDYLKDRLCGYYDLPKIPDLIISKV